MANKSIGLDFIANSTDTSNTSPEEISQSDVFTLRKEWTRQ
jgi:hypothetical protein